MSAAADTQNEVGSDRKGVGSEWHLLKLLGVAIFADGLSGVRTWFGGDRKRGRESFFIESIFLARGGPT